MCKFILLKFCIFNDSEIGLFVGTKVRLIFGLIKPFSVFIFRVVLFNCFVVDKGIKCFWIKQIYFLVATLLGYRIMLRC